MNRRTTYGAAVLAAGVLALSACSNESDAASPAAATAKEPQTVAFDGGDLAVLDCALPGRTAATTSTWMRCSRPG